MFSEEGYFQLKIGEYVQSGHSLRDFDWIEFSVFFRTTFLVQHRENERFDDIYTLMWCDSLAKAHALSKKVFRFGLLEAERASRKAKGSVWGQDDILAAFEDLGGVAEYVTDHQNKTGV